MPAKINNMYAEKDSRGHPLDNVRKSQIFFMNNLLHRVGFGMYAQVSILVVIAAVVLNGFTLFLPSQALQQPSDLEIDNPVNLSDSLFTPYTEKIGESLVAFDMVPIEAGRVVLVTPEGEEEVEVGSFWMSATEVTWDAYDIFAYQLDLSEAERIENADASTRPSRPYEPPDYGFGHQGYAAMSVTFKAAQDYAEWLSVQTGHTYRLATEAEWVHAALAGSPHTESMSAEQLEEMAWYEANADDKTHPVASKAPNPWGLYDMIGNVQEWVVGYDEKPVTRGGSYRDDIDEVQFTERSIQTRKWNERDPQIPKSRWWLSDGPMVGFRVVRSLD